MKYSQSFPKTQKQDPLEIRYFKADTGKDIPLARAWTIPPNYSSGSLKEILSGIVWGQDSRSVVYYPNDVSSDEPQIISDEDLKGLRFEERQDRLAQLDIHAMNLKASPLKILIEQIYPAES